MKTAICVKGIIFLIILQSCGEKTKFNSDLWKSDSLLRYQMIEDVEKRCEEYLGLNREEIINIFGKPSRIKIKNPDGSFFPLGTSNKSTEYIYNYDCLDYDFFKSTQILRVEFDSLNKVVVCFVHDD